MDFTADPRISASLLERIEQFYDLVPRNGATAEPHGALTLFVGQDAGWPYYARPTLGHPGPVTAADVGAVRARQRELGVPEALEWVFDTSPTVADAASAAGLAVQRCPLLALCGTPVSPGCAPDGVEVALVDPDDPGLPSIRAVADIGFGTPGTARGVAGPTERDTAAKRLDPKRLRAQASQLRSGELVQAVARGPAGPLAVGTYQHAAGVAEIVGVATLPTARRRGLAALVTAVLAEHALAAGLGTVFLSAQDETVARVYERVGFRRIATAGLARP
jgi:GNAT superfamily N-acetyltransferase